MIRKPILISVLLMLFPGWVFALGLGNIELNSSLNEPLDARINLVGASVSELDTLKITLASPEAFQRAGVARIYSLTQLRFKLMQPENKPAYIRVSTRQPVKEPFLDFLLEVNWSTGRLFREYTVLIDPPLYDIKAAGQARAPAAAAATSTGVGGTDVQVEHEVHYGAPAPAPVAGAGRQYAGGESVRVGENDTLWSISSRTRPDDSVSVQQMMLAYLRSNPQAFIDGNINGMKAGYVLQMPDTAELHAIGKSEALAEVRRHHELWEQYRLARAEMPAMRAEGAGSSMGTGPTGAVATHAASQDQLKLVTPRTGSLAEGEAAAGSAAGEGGAGIMSDETALVNEKLQSTLQEMGDLRQQLHDADDIISLMEQKLQLKDQQLAELQAALEKQQLAGQEAAPEQMPEQMPEQAPAMPEQPATMEQAPSEETPAPATAEEMAPAAETPAAGAAEEEMQEVEAPAPEAGLLDTVNSYIALIIPAAIMAAIPGGSLTVIGVGLGIILLLLVLLFARRKGGETKAIVEETAPPEPASEQVTEVASEDITESPEPTGETGGELDTESTTQFLAGEEEAVSATSEAPAEEEGEPEEDPLAEVNVYLAYERFDQAEELVKKVIADHPEEDSYRLRLLEVYYSANNKAGYEEAARELHDRVGGAGPLWDSAVAMWSEMSPERALFAEPAPGAEEPVTEAPADEGAQGFVDLTAEEEAPAEVGGDTLSIAPGEPTATSLGDTVSPVEAEAEADTGLDFELATGADTGETAGEEGLLDITQDSEGEGEDMLDLTAASSTADEDLLDITRDSEGEGEDMLDLTAASGAADEDLLNITRDSEGEGEDMLDLTAASGAADEDLLDITRGSEGEGEDIADLGASQEPGGEPESVVDEDDMGLDFTGAEDLLDITTEGEPATGDKATEGGLELDLDEGASSESEAAGADLLDLTGTSELETDLLDVTASGSLEASESESLLDVTSISAPPGGASEEESVLDLSTPVADEETETDDSLLDFDLGDEAETETPAGETSVVDDSGGAAADTGDASDLEFDISGLDLEAEETPETGGESVTGPDSGEDLETTDLSQLVADMDADKGETTAESDDAIPDLDMDLVLEAKPEQAGEDTDREAGKIDELEMTDIDSSLADLSDSLEDSAGPDLEISPEEGLDLEVSEDDSELLETVQLDADEEGGDELSEQTLVMPRADETEEQTDEDEVDTKLNLAKAYIELGDKDGARTILDEVSASGNEQQKKEAEQLAEQLS